MKFIISESKINSLGLEHKSDILYKLIQLTYPNIYEDETENIRHLNFYSEEDGDLLFYYDYEDKIFYVGARFLETLHEMTGLSFLDVEDIISKNRVSFDNLMKIFFKRHYGYDVKKIYFHYR